MSLKILHTSDIHLGAKLSYLGTKAGVHRNQIRETFEKVVDLAVEKKVDLFLVAGDLFNDPFPSKTNVEFVRDQFQKLSKNGVKVAVIAGNHDLLEPGSVFLSDEMKFSEGNIHVFTDNSPWVIEDLDTTVYGVSITTQKSRKSPFSQIPVTKEDKSKIKIALVHGSVEIGGKEADNHPIDPKALQTSIFNYIALGDWHGKLEVSKNKSWYSGSPELIDSDQKEAGNVLIVDVAAETKVIPTNVGKRRVVKQEVDLGKYSDIVTLQKDLASDGGEDVVKIVELKGKKALSFDLDIEELEESLRSKFFYIKVKDESHLEISRQDLDKYPQELITGRYIKLLREKEGVEDEIIDEAIQYGIKMLESSERNSDKKA